MSNYFLNPTALWWAAAGSIIVLFYLLRLRRRPVTVPSVMLWRRVVQDFAANTPFQKLKKNLLLLLQLLVFLLLVTALARPFFESEMNLGGRTAVVVDTSYSMLADDGGETRLDLAREEARRLVDSMKEGQQMMVLAASDRLELLSGITGERGQLLDAVGRLDESVGSTPRLDAALELVDSLAEQVPASVVLVTDGGVPDVEHEFANLTEVQQINVGGPAANLGIVNSAVNYDRASQSYSALARVENFSEEPREVSIDLRIDDRLIESRAREIGPGQSVQVVFEGLNYTEDELAIELGDSEDALALDDRAELVMHEPSTPQVLLASNNSLLAAALRANPNIDVTQTAPGSPPSELTRYDAVVTDAALGENWPGTNYFFIGDADHAMLPGGKGEVSGQQTVVEQQENHQLLRFVDFGSINIGSAYQFEADAGAETIVEGTSGPLLVADERQGNRVVYLAFNVRDSDFPLRSTFPVFLSNTADWVTGGRTSAPLNLAAGDIFQRLVDASVSSVRVDMPGGNTRSAEVRDGTLSFSQTHRLGRYTLGEEVGDPRSFTVNLLNRDESDLNRSASVSIAGEAVGEGRNVVGNREIFRWLILFALVVVVGEWWLFHRRSFG